MDEFTIVTVIASPVDEVFAVIQDVAKTPVWTPGLSEARVTSDGPLEPGSALLYKERSWAAATTHPRSARP